MLAINQDPLGRPGKRIAQDGRTEIWTRDLADGTKAVALFNRGDSDAVIPLGAAALSLSGTWTIRNVWLGKDIGTLSDTKDFAVPKHGAVLLKLAPKK